MAFTLTLTGARCARQDSIHPHPPIIEKEQTFIPSKDWAEKIRKVYEVNLLLCPQCGAEMKIIAFIEDVKV